MTYHEIALALRLAEKLYSKIPKGGPLERAVVDWAKCFARRLCAEPGDKPAGAKAIRNIASKKSAARIRQEIGRLRKSHKTHGHDDEIGQNVRVLASAIGLAKGEEKLFAVQVYLSMHGPLSALFALLMRHDFAPFEAICASLTGVETLEARSTLYSRLPARGLLQVRNTIRKDTAPVGVAYELIVALSPPNRGLGDIERSLFGTVTTSTLTLGDFDFVRGPARLAIELLRGADAGGEKGVHILLHGTPGTGKSELARLLIADAGLSAHAVGETDGYGCEPERYERLEALNLLQSLSRSRSGLALIFDEIEDLFTGSDRIGGRLKANSKLFLNQLLETNPTPMVWTTNSLDAFDPAVVRRMSLVIAMPVQPSQSVRSAIWRRCLNANEIAASDGEISRLGQDYRVAASVASSASRNARLMNGQLGDVRKFADSLAAALDAQPARSHARKGFDPSLITSDTDMNDLIDRIGSRGTDTGFTMLLHGAPGTGKTEFGQALANRLGCDLMQRKCSDLVSKWLGETEQNIAATFRAAADQRQVLMIDEVDYLLADRINARHSWEVSQTNEFLTQMEGFDGILVCTTNLVEHIDPAAARRFDFKIRLNPLDGDRRCTAFESFFDLEAPAGLSALEGLTLGDLAAVRRRLRFEPDQAGNAERILAMLSEELAYKPARPLTVGFRTGRARA